ncbi:MAG: VOC family protein [Chloroflexota bacterium]|nr:VOC family protein [Chloroflexota bacterium]
MFTQIFPIISTADVPRALRFYRDLLGGTVSYQFPAPDGEPGYVGIELGSSHLGIGREPPDAPSPEAPSISLWIYADDCDAAVERLREADVLIVEEPADQPWGERVARVRDPDGNEVIIGARPSRDGDRPAA